MSDQWIMRELSEQHDEAQRLLVKVRQHNEPLETAFVAHANGTPRRQVTLYRDANGDAQFCRRAAAEEERREVLARMDRAIVASHETVARYTGPERRRYPRARKALDAMTYVDKARGQAMRELYERD